MKIKSYLPIFEGFYNTPLTPDEEHEISRINEIREAKGLSSVDWSECEWNYDEYCKEIAEASIEYIENRLNEIGINVSLEFDGIWSPKYYNYETDKVKVIAQFDWEKLKEKFFESDCDEYLKETLSSRSGFSSFYPHLAHKVNWYDVTEPDNVHIEHMMAAILYCHPETEYDRDEYIQSAIEKANYYCTNYEEMINQA